MANERGSGSSKRPTIEVDGVDARDVAQLLEEVAKQIRSKTSKESAADPGGVFKRVETGQLFDVVHRS